MRIHILILGFKGLKGMMYEQSGCFAYETYCFVDVLNMPRLSSDLKVPTKYALQLR